MICSALPKDWIDYFIAITPICIAAFVAIMSYWQSRINNNKLRLDLYNRRFDIYSKTVDFYQALLIYDPSTTIQEESFNAIHKAFIKAFRESQFLFEKESNIYDILEKIHLESFKIVGVKDHGKELAAADPQVFLKMFNQSTEALKWLNEEAISTLEKAIAPYLNFHRMTA